MTDLSLKMLGKSINSIPLFMKGILGNAVCDLFQSR